MPDDLKRYTEYRQSLMLSEGYESVFDPERLRSWFEQNRARVSETMDAGGLADKTDVEQYLQALQAFEPATAYDLPHTRLIFEPLLIRIRSAADEMGRFPIRPVQLATSTDASPTPSALPTGGDHQLYIGYGTSHFCNYWSKAIAAVACNLPAGRDGRRPPRRWDVEEAIRRDPSGLRLAVKLLWAFANTGSVIGLGAVEQALKYLGLRLDLLRAMELFIIGHEYGHFVLHEHAPGYGQPLSIDDVHRLEFACDQIGVNLSRQASHRERQDWLGYCAAGAVAFFRAIEASERARAMIKSERKVVPSDHPTPEDRITVIKETVRRRTDYDQAKAVIGTLNFYDVLTRELGRLALETLRDAQVSDLKSQL